MPLETEAGLGRRHPAAADADAVDPARVTATDAMTVNGTVWATAALLVLVVAGGVFGWNSVDVTAETVALPGWMFPVALVRLRRRHPHVLQARTWPASPPRCTPCSRARSSAPSPGVYNTRLRRHRRPGRGAHHRRVRRDAVPVRHPDHQGHRQAPDGHRRRHRRRLARLPGQHGPEPVRRRPCPFLHDTQPPRDRHQPGDRRRGRLQPAARLRLRRAGRGGRAPRARSSGTPPSACSSRSSGSTSSSCASSASSRAAS